MIVRTMGVDNGVRRTQSTPETYARISNDQRIGFTGDCESEGTRNLVGVSRGRSIRTSIGAIGGLKWIFLKLNTLRCAKKN